jgi:hypothetical protein
MIGDFGKNSEGVHTYSINATSKDEIYKMIDEVRELGFKFWETPNLTFKARTWHVLLKIYIPKELGYPEES